MKLCWLCLCYTILKRLWKEELAILWALCSLWVGRWTAPLDSGADELNVTVFCLRQKYSAFPCPCYRPALWVLETNRPECALQFKRYTKDSELLFLKCLQPTICHRHPSLCLDNWVIILRAEGNKNLPLKWACSSAEAGTRRTWLYRGLSPQSPTEAERLTISFRRNQYRLSVGQLEGCQHTSTF